jgi:hypothetical protein
VLELVGLAVDGVQEVLLRGLDQAELPQMVVGMDGLRCRCGAEELCRLLEAFLLAWDSPANASFRLFSVFDMMPP